MKLFYNPLSPNCYPVLAVAEHLGIDLEKVIKDPFKGETREPEYLKMNPNGKVPVLVDGDFTLWESNSIMIYLADKSETSLWPKDAKTRIEISHWQFWQQAHWMDATATLLFERLIKKAFNMGDPDPKEDEKGVKAVQRYGAVLNQCLEGKQFLVNGQLTLADFSVASPLAFSEACSFPIEDFNHLKAWYGRMLELPAWKNNLPKLG